MVGDFVCVNGVGFLGRVEQMEILVYDRRSIERGIVVRAAYIIVSVRDPNKPPVRFRRPAGLRGVLELAFHDAEPDAGMKLPEGVTLMQPKDASRIWEFVQEFRGQIGAIVCHCEQGMSRSPAIAMALAEALDGDPEAILADSQPNSYVYRLMRDAIAASNGR